MSDVRQFAIISEALDEALEYFAQRMDCDDGSPNQEMSLHTKLCRASWALNRLRQINPDATIYNEGTR